MATEKRPRGRPRGSGKDDAPHLARVADLLVGEPSLKATTAMKRIMQGGKDWGASEPTLLRRWQVKWREQSESSLAAAGERARLAATAPTTPSYDLWAVLEALQSLPENLAILFKALGQAQESVAESLKLSRVTITR
jgi:hypothetical protein